jgi:DNA primase
MREQSAAVVVEGYFDHLALYQQGIRNAVATCGTALTASHVRLIERYSAKAYTLFDADGAGKKATLRALDIFLDEKLPAFVVELTAGDDPDSFMRTQGKEAFELRLAKATAAIPFFLKHFLQESGQGSVESKVKIVDEVLPRLFKVANETERDLYLREISRMLAVPESTLRKRMQGKLVAPSEFTARVPEKRSGIAPQEMLLALLAYYPEVAQRVKEHGVERLFQHDLVPVAELLMDRIADGAEPDWGRIIADIASPETKSRLTAMLLNESQLMDVDPNKAFDQCRLALERGELTQMKELRRELALLDSDSPRYWELLEELNGLRNKKSQLH